MKRQDIVAAGILCRDGKVLLARRPAHKKIAPAKWHLPGGHVEFAEDPDVALVREFDEELRLDVRITAVVDTFSYTDSELHTVGIAYELGCDSIPEVIEFDPADTDEVAWVSEAEVDDYLQPDDHNYTVLQHYFGSLK